MTHLYLLAYNSYRWDGEEELLLDLAAPREREIPVHAYGHNTGSDMKVLT